MTTFMKRSLRKDSLQSVQRVWVIQRAKLAVRDGVAELEGTKSCESLPAILRVYVLPRATVDLEL